MTNATYLSEGRSMVHSNVDWILVSLRREGLHLAFALWVGDVNFGSRRPLFPIQSAKSESCRVNGRVDSVDCQLITPTVELFIQICSLFVVFLQHYLHLR